MSQLKPRAKKSQIWVLVATGCGILLGLALLIQSIATYLFVYDKIIHDEAQQELERKESALPRAAISSGVNDINHLGPIVEQFQKEEARQIAWVRIINFDGVVVAQAGQPLSPPPSADALHRPLEMHRSMTRTIRTSKGEVLIVDSRFRFFNPRSVYGPPGERPGPPPPRDPPSFSEIALYVDSVTVNFTALRQNLIVGCLAALALLASTTLIWVLFKRYIRARELEQQIELARRVQADLLPSAESEHSSEHLEFAAAFIPAATVGGDFYDVFTCHDETISIVLGDVAGKGISAALLMGVLHGAIRSLNWTRSGVEQQAATQRLNQFLCEKTARERFASLFWAYFEPRTGVLRYVNAGHLPPLLVRKTASGSSVEKLESGGPVLGLLPNASYSFGEAKVDAGDVLVVFSDGIAEAANDSDEEFGETRIAEVITREIASPPQAICNSVLRAVNSFLGSAKPHDDQTLLVVRLAPAGYAKSEAELQTSASLAT